MKIRIPATAGNLGPGFDCLGIALKLYNEIEVKVIRKRRNKFSFNIEVVGEGKDLLPRDEKNIVYQAFQKACKMFPGSLTNIATCACQGELNIRLINRIPLTSGLGSSAAARIGGLLLANKICGNRLTEEKMLKLATKLEGHPDNVVPALLGGFCVSAIDNKEIKYIKLNLSQEIKMVVCVPDFVVPTEKARKVLPGKVLLSDTVFTSSRVAFLVSALMKKKYDYLKFAMQDRIHQPYRKKFVPGMYNVFSAAINTGAWGACLSGAGPAIIAISGNKSRVNKRIGQSMVKTFSKHNIRSKYMILDIDSKGACIV